MKYTVNHLNTDYNAIKENLWHRLLNLLDNEDESEHIISKFEVVIEEYNDKEKDSFMNNPIYFDFVLSHSNSEIRISEGIDGEDFIVISLFSSLREKALQNFVDNTLQSWDLNNYVDYLASTHTIEEVSNSYHSFFDDLKSMVIDMEYSYIMQCSDEDLNTIYFGNISA